MSWSRLPMEDDLEGPFGACCYTLTLWEAIVFPQFSPDCQTLPVAL